MERMVSTLRLEIGMYVSNLDRPWLDTPFLIQGYFIETVADIAELQNFCKYVFIDINKGKPAAVYLEKPPGSIEDNLNDFLERNERLVDYDNEKSVLEELPEAESALKQATVEIADFMEDLHQGKSLDLQSVKAGIQPLLESVIRNTDALLWMLKIQNSEDHYQQAMDSCTLGLAFGKFIGLYPTDISTLGFGMLLLDVGKYKVPSAILNKGGVLTREEFAEVKKHVGYGVDMLRNIGGISDAVINMVQTHHERINGSGYPNGLEGEQIPVFGRIAAIIDTYCAMSRKTPYRDAIAQHQILQEMYKWRNKYYQAELVEQFVQCVGVYPTGSLVELTTGEVGIVIAQNMHERLEPTICMLLDENKKPWPNEPVFELSKKRTDANGVKRKILHALRSGAYGISSWEPGKLQQQL